MIDNQVQVGDILRITGGIRMFAIPDNLVRVTEVGQTFVQVENRKRQRAIFLYWTDGRIDLEATEWKVDFPNQELKQ